jgi:hypothetical protein
MPTSLDSQFQRDSEFLYAKASIPYNTRLIKSVVVMGITVLVSRLDPVAENFIYQRFINSHNELFDILAP